VSFGQIYTTTIDTTTPIISATSTNIGETTFTLSFNTNENSTSSINYGLTSIYTASSTNLVASSTHAFTLTGLSPNTLYNYIITVTDEYGNTATSSNQTFTTTAIPVPTPVPTSSGGGGGSSGGGSSYIPVSLSTQATSTVLITTASGTKNTKLCGTTDQGVIILLSNSKLNLKFGSKGNNVKLLQNFLNTQCFPIANSGIGSLGYETVKFSRLTREALIRFQKANNIFPANGYFGPKTKNFIKSLIK
jgi:hypothetical protein